MNVFLVRHGSTYDNNSRVLSGLSDCSLSELGLSQMEELSKKLSKYSATKIYSSPLRRAKESAGVIAKGTELSVSIDGRLTERNYGPYDGWKKNSVTVRI
jgi:broad specificity phosphatase PhoE